MSNPVKTCFLIETFLYENKILKTHNFFLSKLRIYCTRLVMFQLLVHWFACKVGKIGGLKKCGQDNENTNLLF